MQTRATVLCRGQHFFSDSTMWYICCRIFRKKIIPKVVKLGYDSYGAEVEEQTIEYRTFYKLIPGLVVIEYIDEYSYCLDTNKMVDGEYPVILWDNHEGYGYTAVNNFLE